MILSKQAIKASLANGAIEISPFNPDHLKEASYTFTLGDSASKRGANKPIHAKGLHLPPWGFALVPPSPAPTTRFP